MRHTLLTVISALIATVFIQCSVAIPVRPVWESNEGEERAINPPGFAHSTWHTSRNTMMIPAAPVEVADGLGAVYARDEGRLIFTKAAGHTLHGFWIEAGSERPCNLPIDGSYHWGRIEFTFAGDRFEGRWSYCDSFDWAGPWTSTRIMTRALNGAAVLFGRVEYTHFYAVQTGDRPLFERELKAVLAAPEDVLPGRHRLLTVVAQRKARRLLQQADTLFASKPSSSER